MQNLIMPILLFVLDLIFNLIKITSKLTFVLFVSQGKVPSNKTTKQEEQPQF